MPKIDRTGLGQYTAPAVPGAAAARVVPGAFQRPNLGPLADATGRAADAVTRQQMIANEEARRAAEAARQEAEHVRRVEEGTRAKRDALAFGDELTRHREAVLNDPAIPRERKAQSITDYIAARRAVLEESYSTPEIIGAQQVTIDGMQFQAIADLEAGLVEQDRAATQANVAASLEIMGRRAAELADPSALIREAHQHIEAAGQAAGWDEAKVGSIKQTVAEEWTANSATRRLLADPEGTLDALQAGEYPDLDPKTRLALQERARAELEQRANRARIEAEARETRAERVVSQLDRMYYSKGLQPPPDLVATASRLTAGTQLEGELAAMNASQADRAAFAGQPLAVQAAELAALQAAGTDPARGLQPADLAQYQAKQQIHDAIQRDIGARGGLAVAAAHGIVDLEPLSLTNPDELANQLQLRKEAAAVASTWTGAPVSILLPDETSALSEQLKRTPASQQKTVLQGFAKAVGDPEAYAAVMAELAPKNGAAASAGVLLAQNHDHAARAADLILKGEEILAPAAGGKPSMVLPNQTVFAQEFDDVAGHAYGAKANVRRMDLDNTMRVYAALSAQAGDYSRDPQDIDSDRFEQAIEIATGGLAEVNGAPVILPRGMTESQFLSEMRQRLATMRDAGAVPAGYTERQLWDLELENAAQQGQRGYFIRSGGSYLTMSDGATKVFINPEVPDPYARAAGRVTFEGDVPIPPPSR